MKCPTFNSPGSSCNYLGCDCDAGLQCAAPTPAPTPVPTTTPTASPTTSPTPAPTGLCDFANNCSFSVNSTNTIQHLKEAMACIHKNDCLEWNRACSCAKTRAQNTSISGYNCGAEPGCATSAKDKMKKYLPAILGSAGAVLCISAVAVVWIRKRRAAESAKEYNEGLLAWQEGQKQF